MAIIYILGIIGGLYFSRNIVLLLLSISLIIFAFLHKRPYIIVITTVVTISICISSIAKMNYNEFCNLGDDNLIVGKVVREYRNNYYGEYLFKVIEINGKRVFGSKNILLYLKSKNKNIRVGSRVKLKTDFLDIDESRNYGGFNYRRYLATKQIYGITETENIEIIYVTNESIHGNVLHNIRTKIKNNLLRILPETNAHLCISLILGDREYLEDDMVENFENSSLSHLLAISGMHVSYIATMVLAVSKKIKRTNAYILVIMCIIFFSNLVGNTPSVLRASIMLIFYYISKITYRKFDSLTSLSFASIAILFINPFNIYNLGFIMSFLGTLGITLFYKILERYTNKEKNNNVNKYVKSQLNLSLSANFMLAPVVARYYNKVSVVFILSCPIASGLLSVIMPLIMIFITSSLFSSSLTRIISKLLCLSTNLLIYVSKFFSKLKFLNFIICTPSAWGILLYYTIIILFYTSIKAVRRDKKIIKKAIKDIVILYMCTSLITCFISGFSNKLTIHFIDVGQGDATLIVTNGNNKILIDGGGEEYGEDSIGKNILLPYLLDRGIKALDYIMVSHFDSDHVRWAIACNAKYIC